MKISTICFALGTLCLLVLSPLSLIAQLSGTYTVGDGGDFASLSAAVETLNQKGVDGPATFQLQKGRYEEQITIRKVPGAGDRNPIIFESESGNPRDVTIFYQHLGSSASNNEHVIRIDTTDYVTIRNLTIENPGEIYATGVRVSGSAHTTIERNIIRVTPELKFAQPLNACVFAYDAAALVVRSCTLSGGYAGVNVLGPNEEQPVEGILIENNRMQNGRVELGGAGVTIQDYMDAEIVGNTITQQDGTGINLDNCDGALRVEANRITMRPERFATGINATQCDGGNGRSLFANNAIINIGGDTLTACIGLYFNATRNSDILFNSVHLANSNTDRFQSTTNVTVSFATFNNDSLRIYNNVFTNMRDREVISYPIGNAYFEADHNNLYTNGDRLGFLASGPATNLDSIQRTSGRELQSYSIPPCYTSRDDLQTNSAVLDGAGKFFAEVPRDIDGRLRDPEHPDIGAFEYTFDPSGLSGTYTVGPGGDYETLAEAVEDLHTRCVEGPVEFAMLPGTHTGRHTINRIPGTSETNTITLRSETNRAEDAVLSYQFRYFIDYLLRLRNAEHVVLRNLTLRPTDTIFQGASLWLAGNPNNILIEENFFENGMEESPAFNTSHIYSEDGSIPSAIRIHNNRFLRGVNGIYLMNCFGLDCEDTNRVHGTEVTGNSFLMADSTRNARSPISLYHHESPLLEGNELRSAGTGINLVQCAGFVRVMNNNLDIRGTDLITSFATGINFTFPGRMEPFGLISNNMVRVHDPAYAPDRATSLTGLNLGQAKNMFVLYNSVVVHDSAGQSLALAVPFGTDSIVLYNNILANYSGGPALRIKFVERFYREFGFDYNLFYSTGDTIGIWNDTGRTSLAAIQGVLGTDSNSIVADPHFLSSEDLHIDSQSPAVNAGFAINNLIINDVDYSYLIAEDIDGEPRGRDRTEIGADELDIVSVRERGETSGKRPELSVSGMHHAGQELTVRFRLHSGSHVRLAFTDLTGKNMVRLANRIFSAGEHAITVNTGNFATGPYWFFLETESGTVSVGTVLY